MTGETLQSLARKLWAEREVKCLSIIQQALTLLGKTKDLPEMEAELNREFYFCLLEATRELYPDDEIPPIAECTNQPDPDHEAQVKREQKRPDFQWIYLDRYEADPERSSRQFVVECKRLGKPSSPNWVFNLNYSKYGVARFHNPEWAYGKFMQSGAMVGYWQSMKAKDVLREVNNGCKADSLPELKLVGAWNDRGTSRLEQVLKRAFEISPFKLHHFWIDLRP